MRGVSALVFDDIISGSSDTWYSGEQFNQILGTSDAFAIQAVVTAVATGSTLTVHAEHSGDDQNWTDVDATAQIDGKSIDTSPSVYGQSAEDLLQSNIRFKITLGGAGHKCRLKLYATGRIYAGRA